MLCQVVIFVVKFVHIRLMPAEYHISCSIGRTPIQMT